MSSEEKEQQERP